jgi:hypothetical protein
LAELSPRASGALTLGALITNGRYGTAEAAGVAVQIERGRVSRVAPSDGEEEPATWALGTAEAWPGAKIGGAVTALRAGGAQPRLARHLVKGIGRPSAAVPEGPFPSHICDWKEQIVAGNFDCAGSLIYC